jgi:hypothetical protein
MVTAILIFGSFVRISYISTNILGENFVSVSVLDEREVVKLGASKRKVISNCMCRSISDIENSFSFLEVRSDDIKIIVGCCT